MQDFIRVGIAGYGVVGERRRIYIDKNLHMKTVAVCDTKFASKGKFDDGVPYFTNYKDLLDMKLDALFVCMPNNMAAEVTIAGLQAGLHVFCEKPPGTCVEDIVNVIKVERQKPGLALKYGFNHRYHDSVREALRMIESRELGEIVNLRGIYGKSKVVPFSGNWRAVRKYAGGGILLDQGIHMVDLMRLFCGEFTEVKSFVSNSYWNHDVEDNAFAMMKDARGRVGMLQSSATQWQHRFSLEITLDKGFLELRGLLSGSKSYGQETLAIVRRNEDSVGSCKEEVIWYLEDNSWRDEVDEFAAAIKGDKKIISGTSKDALETMKLVFRVYYADEAWREKFNIPNPDALEL